MLLQVKTFLSYLFFVTVLEVRIKYVIPKSWKGSIYNDHFDQKWDPGI